MVLHQRSHRSIPGLPKTGLTAPGCESGLKEGFHLHFITRARDLGGPVFGFQLQLGKLEPDEMLQLDLALPASDEFRQANLVVDNEELDSAEKSKGS